MKDINEIYKDWCGIDKHTNDCHPVHDSSETIEFAEYYHNEMKQGIIGKINIPKCRMCNDTGWQFIPFFGGGGTTERCNCKLTIALQPNPNPDYDSFGYDSDGH